MSAFLYFIEERSNPVASDAERARLGIAHAGSFPYHGPVQEGPSGGRGYLLTNDRELGDLPAAYDSERQRWIRRSDGVWVGVYSGHMPTVESLAKPNPIDGDSITVEGVAFNVPRVLAHDTTRLSQPALPAYLDLDSEGHVVAGEVLDAHRWLLDAVSDWFEDWADQCAAAHEAGEERWLYRFERDQVTRQAATVLSANYRVQIEELILLRAWTTDRGPYEVLYAACDCGMYEYLASKKKLPAASS